MKSRPSFPARLGALACGCLLTACASQDPAPVSPPEPRPVPPEGIAVPPGEAGRDSPLGDLFAPAMTALDQGDWMRAELARPAPAEGTEPSAEFRAWSALVRARGAYLRGDLAAFRDALAAAPRQPISRELALRLLSLERLQARQRGDHLASARLAIRARALWPAETDAARGLEHDIWRDLQRLDDSAAASARATADPALRGWLDWREVTRGRLAAATWQSRHGDHPARRMPVPGAAEPPQQVALLLPLSGRLATAGSAVRDGFLAAHYATAPGARPGVSFVDTTRFPDAAAAYRRAVAGGAELVLGPLSKEAVAEVLRQPALPVPLLTLNRVDASGPAAAQVLQFSLAPEDEARLLARRALGAGYRRALLLRPAGSWGDRMAQALSTTWTNGGGVIAASGTYASREGHSDTIERALALDESRARGQALRQLVDRDLVLAGRRRQDLDVVFMLAPDSETARSLKPLLAYHYAGELPAYASSAANSAEITAADRDLAGLRLLELPWFLGATPELRAALAAGDLPGADLSRLQALGADAQLLTRHYGALAPRSAVILQGATGTLAVDAEGVIRRELPLAIFASGGLQREPLD